MQCEISWRSGLLRGFIQGQAPHFDSPMMYLESRDRHYVILRMRYHGLAKNGLVVVRGGGGDQKGVLSFFTALL